MLGYCVGILATECRSILIFLCLIKSVDMKKSDVPSSCRSDGDRFLFF
jgi:hypothetical protein